ncbi:MAG: hypothetical protein CR982_09070 [Candidatus Cloacimonadota bacterium]|nr:MAG: hypothetical protein CR982_09070 [Candidatus Cloacimonadota bacterium]PIE78617.1 MAG: hypothetical protein CSA15_06965 [Candidatus Delongbacteria bacterium]
MSQMNNTNRESSKRMDKRFYRVLLITGIIYFTIFFIAINISTKGPDREILKEKKIKRTVHFITKKEVEFKEPKEKIVIPLDDTDVSDDSDIKKEIIQEKISETVEKDISTKDKNQLNKKSEKQRIIDKKNRRARRVAKKERREREARIKVSSKIQRIQSLKKGYRSSGAVKYSEYEGTAGNNNFASTLKKSGTLSGSGSGGGTTKGVGKESASIDYSGGSLDDFFASSDFGEVSTVEGIENVRVSELRVEKGEQKSGRTNSQINRYIEKKVKSFDKCVKAARSTYKTLTGAITIRFTIKSNGKVRKVVIVSSKWSNSRGGKKVEKCIRNKIRGWRFKKAKGDITISKAFSFL